MTTFTTRQWIEESKPILRVVHDNDGDWQFLTSKWKVVKYEDTWIVKTNSNIG
ncbi:MAG: hypothetical protein LBJ04_19525 [Sphingobacterium sp.]|jgi:hypothetical protein|nr:hypothetical protein [Sphingobacterium sp.]